jgi:hypothetical protein
MKVMTLDGQTYTSELIWPSGDSLLLKKAGNNRTYTIAMCFQDTPLFSKHQERERWSLIGCVNRGWLLHLW